MSKLSDAEAVIRHARFPEDTSAVLNIWREYVASPSVSLDYQGNEQEFAELPGKYAAPDGRILLAHRVGQIEGCIALRKVDISICEMKKLYVRPRARGLGLGQKLVQRLINEAREIGYQEMRLDVLAEFRSARKIYQSLGFVAAEPVSFNPVPDTSFLGLKLR
jgi:putative acetyltransferase